MVAMRLEVCGDYGAQQPQTVGGGRSLGGDNFSKWGRGQKNEAQNLAGSLVSHLMHVRH